jgi:hypothetical protein
LERTIVVLRPVLPAAEPALLDHRDVADPMLLGQIVGGGEPVPAAADDDGAVRAFGAGLRHASGQRSW